MRVPEEILLQILRYVADILPFDEILQARLVNHMFAEEIISALIQSSRLENEMFRSSPRWARFPHYLRVRYLRHKLEQHGTRPCKFSTWMHEMLETEYHRPATAEQRDAVTEKLLVGAACGRYKSRDLFAPEMLDVPLQSPRRPLGVEPPEPLEVTYNILMASQAIWRGDAAELDAIVERGHDLATYSTRFCLRPLHLAARMGTGDIIRVLVKHNCPMYYRHTRGTVRLFSVAWHGNNTAALEVWIEDMKITSRPRMYTYLFSAIREAASTGRVDMVEFLITRGITDPQDQWYNALMEAIVWGQVHAVEQLLDRGDFDPRIPSYEYRDGPLFGALLQCRVPKARLSIVRALLEHEFNLNELYNGVPRTPLQRAMELGDVEIAALLLEYGAVPHVRILPRGSKGRKKPPFLHLARELNEGRFVRLLLEKGADHCYRWKRRNYTVQVDKEQLGRVERIFEELGFDEDEVKATKSDYMLANKIREGTFRHMQISARPVNGIDCPTTRGQHLYPQTKI
ncbi:ankyrin repeat-containing domain protein [Aspergillus floccosus]